MAKKRISYRKKYKPSISSKPKPSLITISSVLAIVFIAYIALMGLVSTILSFGNKAEQLPTDQGLSSFNITNIDTTNLGIAVLLLVGLVVIIGIVITVIYRKPAKLSPMAKIKRRR